MSADEWIVLKRALSVVAIPGGQPLALREGSRVRVRQALGGRFVVATSLGTLARVDGRDADALGLPPPDAAPAVSARAAPPGSLEERVWRELRSCFDPEIPVNIVELGLIYALDVVPLDRGEHEVRIDMTLTAPGCGMGEVLKAEIEAKLRALPEVSRADVRLVFDPPWDPGRMSEAARLQLGL